MKSRALLIAVIITIGLLIYAAKLIRAGVPDAYWSIFWSFIAGFYLGMTFWRYLSDGTAKDFSHLA